jgi:hypothetical protein
MFKEQRLQSMDKQELQDMLSTLSETELSALGDILNNISKKPRNKRRGSGKRKTKRKTSEATSSKDTGLIHNLNLSPEEQNELQQASKFDKTKGLDKPKTHDIMSNGPKFKKVSIKCMDCGKMSEVAPALVPPERDRFRCNSCSCRGHTRER